LRQKQAGAFQAVREFFEPFEKNSIQARLFRPLDVFDLVVHEKNLARFSIKQFGQLGVCCRVGLRSSDLRALARSISSIWKRRANPSQNSPRVLQAQPVALGLLAKQIVRDFGLLLGKKRSEPPARGLEPLVEH